MVTPLQAWRLVYDDIERVPPRRFAIVLGCGVRDGQPSLVLADRLRVGLALHRAARVERLVVSGNSEQVPVMADWLTTRGVPAADLVLDPAGHRTLATMRRAAGDLGVGGAIVCTNRFHIHRALFLAHAEGIDAVGISCDQHVYATRRRLGAREVGAWARALYDVYLRR